MLHTTGRSDFGSQGFAGIATQAAPEPAPIALVLTGLMAVVLRGRRLKKRTP